MLSFIHVHAQISDEVVPTMNDLQFLKRINERKTSTPAVSILHHCMPIEYIIHIIIICWPFLPYVVLVW